jgi:hypothetical protein
MTQQTLDGHGCHAGQDPGIWELVPVADYRLPHTPAVRAAQARWGSLKRLFGGRRYQDERPVRAEADLRGLSEQQLDALVAAVDWGLGANLLERIVGTNEAGDAVCFVIAPPGSGHVDLLHRWATEQGASWITPPKYQDILEAGPTWLADWPSDARYWVLPRLEHCWLRHAAGLALVRELLDRALAGRLGHGIIGCDSWAWAYFRYVAPLPTRSALTLQACDGERLAALFRDLVAQEALGQVRFCNAQTGKLVLAVGGEDDDDGGAELQSLAAHCRGNAGLARELWRGRLRAEPKAKGTGEGAARQEAGAAADNEDDATTVWVAAPPEEPALMADGDEELALVLHALLLHNGLPSPLLAELLPLPSFRVQASLHRLVAAGVVAAAPAGHCRITAPSYPAARELLRSQGFLVDDF